MFFFLIHNNFLKIVKKLQTIDQQEIQGKNWNECKIYIYKCTYLLRKLGIVISLFPSPKHVKIK